MAKKAVNNTSGVYPCGDRLLVRPDKVERKVGMIEIPELVADKRDLAQVIGTVIAVGPDAWTHFHEYGEDGKTAVMRGFSGNFAEVGDKVMFSKYGGLQIRGKDGVEYKVINDVDITALVDEDLKVGDLQTREPYGS